MIDITSGKITATPDTSGWAQVHEFAPNEPDKFLAKGRLFVVIGTKEVSQGVGDVAVGREILSKIHAEYFDGLKQKPFDALKSSLEKALVGVEETWGDIEIGACAFVNGVVYSAAIGGVTITICRNGALATILESFKNGVTTASGYPKEGDAILMATKSFYQNIPQETIKMALAINNSEQASEILTPVVHGQDGLGSLGAAIINFGEKAIFAKEKEEFVEVSSSLPQTKSTIEEYREKISGVLGNVFKKLPQRQIYIKGETENEFVPQNKKLTFSVGVILLIILAVSIIFGIRQKKINETKSKYQSILIEANSEVDQAISLASVSPDKSRELFILSEEKLKQLESLKVKDSKILELKQKIESSRASILGEYIASPQLFLDLSLLSSGFSGDDLSSSGGNIFILDKKGKKIVSVAISSKKSKVVAGPGVIDAPNSLASYEDRAFVLESDGIYEIGNTKNKVVEKTWGGEALIRAFAGNIYVLDKSANQIYRYPGNGNTFGEMQNWLAGGTAADFSSIKQWVIDGAVYALNPNSKVLKFSQGSPQSFKITGTIPEIGSVDAIYASDETQFVYFLDKAGKRVVVTDKKGNYKAQYIGEEIGNATNLVVSEADKKIVLLSGDKLLSIDIKHL
ncbi:MAG TPA: hypothetical protein VFI61_00025 [Patescibacteria group bacterium]|nr:hypothetical protein [Patescibacteria group bacterium]